MEEAVNLSKYLRLRLADSEIARAWDSVLTLLMGHAALDQHTPVERSQLQQ
jgi:hypothetical protein